MGAFHLETELHWLHRDCPVCGGKDARLVFRDRNRREGYDIETDLVECAACAISIQFHKQVTGWGNTRSGTNRFVIGEAARVLAAIWHMHLIWGRDMRFHLLPHGSGEGKKILDIGCGSGGKLIYFHKRGFQVFGIDVSRTAIAEARGKVDGDFRVGAFESADYPPDFFDVIRFDNVLEHIYDPKAFLQKVFRILRAGGAAYGYVPNGVSPTLR